MAFDNFIESLKNVNLFPGRLSHSDGGSKRFDPSRASSVVSSDTRVAEMLEHIKSTNPDWQRTYVASANAAGLKASTAATALPQEPLASKPAFLESIKPSPARASYVPATREIKLDTRKRVIVRPRGAVHARTTSAPSAAELERIKAPVGRGRTRSAKSTLGLEEMRTMERQVQRAYEGRFGTLQTAQEALAMKPRTQGAAHSA